MKKKKTFIIICGYVCLEFIFMKNNECKNGKIDKKDFFQLLLQLKHHGTMHGDKNNWSVGNETGSYDTVDSCNWRIFLSSRVI